MELSGKYKIISSEVTGNTCYIECEYVSTSNPERVKVNLLVSDTDEEILKGDNDE